MVFFGTDTGIAGSCTVVQSVAGSQTPGRGLEITLLRMLQGLSHAFAKKWLCRQGDGDGRYRVTTRKIGHARPVWVMPHGQSRRLRD